MLPGRNILIFHSGALGDFIVTWPLALTLARLYPQSRVFYVTSAGKGTLAEKVLRVESLDVEAGWHHLFGDPRSLPEAARKRLTSAHTIVSFVAAEQERWTDDVRSLVPQAQVLPLSSKPPEDFPGHVSEFILSQLADRSAAHTAGSQILRSVAARGLAAPSTPREHILIHPGAGSPAKRWPAEHFAQLADRLRAEGFAVRVLLGEVERETWNPAQIARLSSAAQVVDPISLVDLLEQVRVAQVFVGNDSGPGHLAGIIGVPTLSIFGPADPVRWKPLGPAVEVVRGASLEAVNVTDIYDRVVQLAGSR